MPSNNRVAIVGIGGLFSKSLTLEQFWNNIVTGTDTSTEIPAGRWPLPSESIFDSTVGRTDTVYSTRGYFIENWQFDPSLHDLDPSFLADLDPLFHITLQVGRQAWEDCRTDALDRGRCGVILGSLCLPTDGASAFAEHFVGNTILEQLGADIPPGAAHPPPESCHPAGLPSELLARSLGLEGTCFTLDAACASSLYAIKLAVDKLLSGAADAIIAGGVSRPDCLYTQMGFSQLRALSPTGKCSPFDVKADGLVVGEGGAMFVLKRLQDAVQQGDYIYGVLAGVGLSNDTQGNVLAPDSAGQLRAMRLAYEQAGWRPNEVDYIECHATGTALGDGVELRSLTQLWEGCSPHTCALGSVKANVGHTLTAAGAAGLLKVLLAIKHQTLPPATNLESPLLQLQEDKQSWTLLRDGQTWEQRQSDIPRRAAVSAFGFGGINAHLLIEEWIADQGTNTFAITTRPRYPVPLAIVGVHAALDNSPDLDAVRASWFSNEQQEKNSESTFRWWGVEEATWLQGFLHSGETRHTSLDQVKVPRTAFRIPPSDLQEMLPQQLLMLNVARRALQDVLGNTGEKTRTGVFIGLGLDPNTTNFHLRWWFKRTLEQSRKVTDTSSTQETLNRLQDSLDSIHPPLTAGRTLGALASITASRISREFGLGGPSFTITSPTDSGADALETARQLLENNEIDTAVVGAVDFPSDVRATIARHLSSNPDLAESRPSEGAIAFVLKRFEDAQQAEDHIYAVLENETADRHDPQSSLKVSHPPNLSSTKFGHLGYLVNLLRGTLAVAETRVPRSVEHQGGLSHYWFQDTADGFRSVVVGVPPPRSNEATRLVMSHSQQPWTSLRPSQLPLPEGLFVVRATHQSQFPDRLKELQSFVDQSPASSIDQLARHWHQYHSRGPEQLLCTFVVPTREDLTALLDQRLRSLSSGADDRHDRFQPQLRTQSFSTLDHKVISKGKLGLVFPGSGNWHPGMGRELFLHWPQSLERQEADNQWLRSQYRPEVFWEREDLEGVETRKLLMGQVAYGTGVSDLLELFGVRPDAAIGYSLGETTLLFATRIWQDRDTMLHRLMQSPLFHSDLCGDYQAARQYWQLSKDEDVDWIAGIVPCQPAEVSRALQDVPRAYLLIKNSDSECVIGGHRRSVDQVVSRLRCGFLPTAAQSSVHCPIVRVVEDRYRRLHTLPVTSTPTIAIYSGARGAVYTPSLVSAAHAVTSQALETLDFPRVIQQAYEDGVRTFLEVGPGQNCTRLIGQILRDRPHLAVGINSPREGEVQGFLRVLAQLISNGHNINLDPLYGPARSSANDVSSLEIDTLSIHVPVGHLAPTLPAVSKEVARALVMVAHPPNQSTLKSSCTFAKQPDVADVTPSVPLSDKQDADVTLPVPATSSTQFSTNTQPRHSHWTTMHPDHTPEPRTYSQPFQALLSNGTGHHSPDWLQTYASLLRQRGEAHQSYLAFADRAQKALSSYMTSPIVPSLVKKTPPPAVSEPEMVPTRNVVLDREQCLEFAVGTIGAVLGTAFAEVDTFPTRVRLPDEPLMLVDRILTLEGEPKSMTSGRVVTEHDVKPRGWYLDNNRMPSCIAIESGQADLFLSGYLGIDFQTRGLAVYRLLDAAVTFHRELPESGQTIQYDIHIDEFFRQGQTYLFRFRFQGTVDGEPLLTMTDGCAGFFTEKELAAGQGIVAARQEGRLRGDPKPLPWLPQHPSPDETYTANQLDALQKGDLVGMFGGQFAELPLQDPLTIPGGQLRVLDRIVHIDPQGGFAGLGTIRAEQDIEPDAWFLTCHFIDDQVMPGTLMYECCLHTLRVYLLRVGWLGPRKTCHFEPVPGVVTRLKCRGQVTANSKVASYEVTLKELGYSPHPYAIADATMFADGKPVVLLTGLSMRLSGTTEDELHQLWQQVNPAPVRPPIYSREQILAFAVGKPSEAFGGKYKAFDHDRRIARLPGPPYAFLDRITQVTGEPWVMAAGATAEGEYDVPHDAWYFTANRQETMPFAVLLEVALQPCGWLAAYVGSALTSPVDLRFRNLGGTATQHRAVNRESGTLITNVELTRVSHSGGMIIQHFNFSVRDARGMLYEGTTYFGFFSDAALANQVGIQEETPYLPDMNERTRGVSFLVPTQAPFPDKQMRMIDQVDLFFENGGPTEQGIVVGSVEIDPEAWFFHAHFYQDPVWPGSLGLESFIQLLKVFVHRKFGPGRDTHWESPKLGRQHNWKYRGQVLPTDSKVVVQAEITDLCERERFVRANGWLSVDGRLIYQMTDFTITWK